MTTEWKELSLSYTLHTSHFCDVCEKTWDEHVFVKGAGRKRLHNERTGCIRYLWRKCPTVPGVFSYTPPPGGGR